MYLWRKYIQYISKAGQVAQHIELATVLRNCRKMHVIQSSKDTWENNIYVEHIYVCFGNWIQNYSFTIEPLMFINIKGLIVKE